MCTSLPFALVAVILLCVRVLGIDYGAMKDSNQKEELVDTVLRVRSASIVKMVNSGHRADSKVLYSLLFYLLHYVLCYCLNAPQISVLFYELHFLSWLLERLFLVKLLGVESNKIITTID